MSDRLNVGTNKSRQAEQHKIKQIKSFGIHLTMKNLSSHKTQQRLNYISPPHNLLILFSHLLPYKMLRNSKIGKLQCCMSFLYTLRLLQFRPQEVKSGKCMEMICKNKFRLRVSKVFIQFIVLNLIQNQKILLSPKDIFQNEEI